jgi:hypothetical protein
MRFGWPVGIAILVVGCSTMPVPSSSAKPIPAGRIRAPEFTHAQEGFALVVVTRDKSLAVLACTAHLHVDGVLVADLRPSEQIRLFLEEGQHLVGVSAMAALVEQIKPRSTSHGQGRSYCALQQGMAMTLRLS